MTLPVSLGRLRRVRQLGAGGFATVWLYRDDELRSDVAVKALADNWAQRLDVRERFLEEARILRAADSDHVVRVHDLGEVDDTPYFVMTYADRGSLDVGLRGTAWPVAPALEVVRQAGTGLTVLHQRGIVHRDIKPQNLLLRSDGADAYAGPEPASAETVGAPVVPVPETLPPEVLATSRVMVADLGVAKAMVHGSGLTQVVGTPAYMAPEQVTGGPLDPRADVHALGAVAYHLLTGRVLREGGFAELVEARDPVPPSELADLPAGVDDVLLRSVRPDPEERWPDVATFVAALEASASGTRASVATAESAARVEVRRSLSPESPPESPPAGPRTGPSTLLAVVLVLLVLAASFGVAFAVVRLL